MKKDRLVYIIAFLCIAIVLTAVLVFSDFDITLIWALISFAVVISVFIIYSNIKYKKVTVKDDELLETLRLKCSRNSLLSVYAIISIFSLLQFFKIINASMEIFIFYLVIGMSSTFFISMFIYKKRLETE